MVSPEKFVKAWQSSENAKEVMKKLRLSKAGVSSRAASYRKKGIPLKRLAAMRSRLDVEALKELAKSITKKEKK